MFLSDCPRIGIFGDDNNDDDVDDGELEKLIARALTTKYGGQQGGYDNAADKEREDGDKTLKLRWQGAGVDLSV